VLDDLEEFIAQVQGEVRVGPLHALNGDRIQVRQLFQNIISNALKYRKEKQAPHIQVKSHITQNGFCEITVEDNGIGFDERDLERMFQPFERLHTSVELEGTGIGLTTCQRIVLRHGGEITARSEPGKGSVFIIRLPLHHNKEKPETH